MIVVYVTLCSAKGKAAEIFGRTIAQVITGSMEPSIHKGDYILIRRTDPDKLKKGDIITFYSDDSQIKGMLNTHRIIEINDDGTFITKGDANPTGDRVPVRKEMIIGKYQGKIRLFNWIGSFASGKKLLMLLVIIPMLLLSVYEAKSILSMRDKIIEERERLIRKQIDEEKARLYSENSNNEGEAAMNESREDNEGEND